MSEENCKNDCIPPLRFPRHPGTEPASVHGKGCSCCSPVERVSQDNRPALSHFNYRIGTYGTIREFLFHEINRMPELLNWTHRESDDPAVALLEGAAILGDILAFYQDTYANEAFLRTAKWRESVSDLVRLLGYRLSPAVGGEAQFAFEIKKDEPVTIPVGFPLKATLEKVPKPAEFETTEEIIAYPWLSRFNLFAPLSVPAKFSTEFEIAEPKPYELSIEIKVGDRLLIGESDVTWTLSDSSQPTVLADAEIVIVDSIRELHGSKIFKVKGKLKLHEGKDNVVAYRLGRAFHHFGYNSPAFITDLANPVKTVVDTPTPPPGHSTVTSTINTLKVPFERPFDGTFSTVKPELADKDYPLEMEVRDLPGNVPIIVQARFSSKPEEVITAVRSISHVTPVTMVWGGITGAVSKITISSSLSSSATDTMNITDALFHEVTSPLLKINAARTPVGGSGLTLNFYGPAAQAATLAGRKILRDKKGASPKNYDVRQVSLSTPGDETHPALHTITLSKTVDYSDYPQTDPLCTIYGNLVNANEGKTVTETPIGDGNATQIFQNFKLPKAPLTYHIVAANTPVETPEAEVYVDGRLWKKVDSFFGHEPDEHIYIIREDAEGASWVQFGDGKTGARLTNGTKNVTARYRIGDGAYGALKADTKVQASAKLKNLDKIQMPRDVTGGASPESVESARSTAPGKVQSLGRIVSIDDFAFEAMAIPGVVAVSVDWQLEDNIPGVDITVLMQEERLAEFTSVSSTLNSYNRQRGAGRFAIRVKQGSMLYASVAVEYALEPTYRKDIVEPAIRLALGVNYENVVTEEDQIGLFSLRHRRFGLAEYASSIEGTVQNVEGVLWARTTFFAEAGNTTSATAISCSSDQILSLRDKDLSLTEVAN